MLKWSSIGFLGGMLVAVLLFFAIEHRRAPAIEAAAARLSQAEKSAATAAETASETRARLEKSTSEITTLRAENKELQARLETERAAAAGPQGKGPGAGFVPPRRRSLKDLAADLARWNDKLKGRSWDTWPKEAKALQEELLAAMRELGIKLGMSPEEAMRSPDGLGLLLVELLAQSVPPLDAAQEAMLRELLAGERPAWDAWLASRDSMSTLEARRKFLEITGASRDAFFAALTPEQRATVGGYGFFETQIQGSQTWFDGSRAVVTQALASQWTATLNLDERQAQAVAPIVQSYIDESRQLNDAIWARRRAGEELSREKDYGMRLELMIQTQKKIADAALLTEEQAKAMKEWQFTYGVNVTDEMEK